MVRLFSPLVVCGGCSSPPKILQSGEASLPQTAKWSDGSSTRRLCSFHCSNPQQARTVAHTHTHTLADQLIPAAQRSNQRRCHHLTPPLAPPPNPPQPTGPADGRGDTGGAATKRFNFSPHGRTIPAAAGAPHPDNEPRSTETLGINQ